MIENIEKKDMDRMFPFEFFFELSEKLEGFVFNNPAFMVEHKDKNRQKEVFEKSRDNIAMSTLMKNNILDIEPFGEVLIIELCSDVEKLKHFMKTHKEQAPLSILIGQLYDSSDLPVFSKEVSKDTISKIPEVLWDDPNLMLSVLSFEEDGAKLAVIKIPERIEKKVLEGV